MKAMIACALRDALGCPVYDETVPQGMETPSCVILPPEYRAGRVICATYQIAVRGISELAPLFMALHAVKDADGKVFRGEDISAADEDGVCVVSVTYRYTVSMEDTEECALMLSMERQY